MANVGLFRGVNVGGRSKVSMSDLRQLLESLGLRHVRTYIQSGNVVFDAEPGVSGRLADDISKAFEHTFGFSATVGVISDCELARIVGANPFAPGSAAIEHLYVTFLLGPPMRDADEEDIRRLAGSTPDEFVLADSCVYLRCPNGYGRTKLSNAFFERALGVRATTRNYRTVLRLLALAEETES
jgi:uncharacterized protein (DUF1697 family)